MAVGFAALNTGNNLLFFGWGLLLSSIVISGVLSEATLRGLAVKPEPQGELRAGALSPLPVLVENQGGRLPAFGVEVVAHIDDGGEQPRAVKAPFLLRLSAGDDERLRVRWIPERRGELSLAGYEAMTAYPFGFFEKSRRLPLDRPQPLVVYPARVDVSGLQRTLLSRLGETPTRRAGPGDELFALRPYREGDDPRFIAWRRSLRGGRLMVRETEAHASRAVLLELMFPQASKRDHEATERAIAVLGSLAEELLRRDEVVGVRTAGVLLLPAPGPRQRAAILTALARLDPDAPLAPAPVKRGIARVALAPSGFPVAGGADHVLALAVDGDERRPGRAA